MRRQTLRLSLGTLPFDVLPDGRVLVTLPATRLPFGAAIRATVLYPTLRSFLTAMRQGR
jgi:hypothetical protein